MKARRDLSFLREVVCTAQHGYTFQQGKARDVEALRRVSERGLIEVMPKTLSLRCNALRSRLGCWKQTRSG